MLGNVAIFSRKKHIFLALLGSWVNQTAVGAFIVRNMAIAHHKAGGLHHLAADFFKCPRAEVRHVDGIFQQQFYPQLFKAGQEHPSVLGNHCLIAVFTSHLPAALDEYREQVALAVRVVLFHKLAEPCVHIRAAHIRRIRHHHIILLRHDLGYTDQR